MNPVRGNGAGRAAVDRYFVAVAEFVRAYRLGEDPDTLVRLANHADLLQPPEPSL